MKSRLSLLILLCLVLCPISSWAAPQDAQANVKAQPEEKKKKTTKKAAAEKPATQSTEKPAEQAESSKTDNANKESQAKNPAPENAAEKTAQTPASSAAPAAKPASAPAPASTTAQSKPLVGNATKGKGKTQTCVACHGQDGNSTVPNWPKIAGQYQDYLVKQLKDFRLGEKGPRYEPSMFGMVATLNDQDIADLAAFYAGQKQTMGKAQEQYVAWGEKIYRGGNIQTGVTACLACHGPDGKGNEAAKFPKLAGQHSVYIENQLHNFRDGKRKNSPNGMMESISHRMNEEEIKAVSSYIEGLREREKS